MAKTVGVDIIADLKKVIAADHAVLGTDETVKLLRRGKVKKVFMSSNCDPVLKDDIQRLCKMNNVEIVELSQSNEEIGVLCKKPFSISVVGVTA